MYDLFRNQSFLSCNKNLSQKEIKLFSSDKAGVKKDCETSFRVLCVTNRGLCREEFLSRIRKIVAAGATGIVLREKDLTEAEYKKLADKVMKICSDYGIACILHSFVNVAKELECKSVHLPLPVLRTLSGEDKKLFDMIGASCHSVDEAVEAERLGCDYIVVGHIFETDCKKNFPGRGVSFLHSVCERVSIPVYAIGGICKENVAQIKNAGAYGACVMSGVMVCENVEKYLDEIMKG